MYRENSDLPESFWEMTDLATTIGPSDRLLAALYRELRGLLLNVIC